MEWSKVEKQHVEAAIKKFIEEKPDYPEPRSYYLMYEGEKLPSKYIRGLAYSIATGEEMSLSGFSGGVETVNFFKKYGYTVEQLTDDNADKYSVNDAVWIATALMAAEKYSNTDAIREDMFFKQSEIVKRAQSLIKSKVDSARVSWWVNADNEKHTQNYLRADSLTDPSSRRLSMLDEFPEKSYPKGLDMSDVLEMNGFQMTMEELFFFVKEQYPEVINKMQTVDIDYLGVLDYLENNQEIPYSNPEASGVDPDEKIRLLEVKQKGQAAVAEMKKMASRCADLYELDKCLPISWLDGSNTKTRKYLWAQMKYKDYVLNPVSISLFVEKNDGVTRYRISLEIKNDGTDKATMAKYHSHLDMPIKEGMVYVSGSNEWGNPAVITDAQDTIKTQIESGEIRKVQLCIYIEPSADKTNEQYDKEIMEAVKKLIPYYEHVIGKSSTLPKRAWLITWNPANWTWDNYEEWCVDTKNGIAHEIAWTCASKQPMIGDEVFLIKTGAQPRGIMAHGYVSTEAYEAPHYDPDKVAEGVTSNHIDVEFDWIQNYENEPMLMQDSLKEKYPQQQWSPMGSGIEIKEPILTMVKEEWQKLIEVKDEFWPSYKEYPVDLTKEDWKRFLDEVEYPSHKGCIRVLKCMLEIGGISSCKQLSDTYGGHPTMYTSSVYNTSHRALQFFNMEPCPDGEVKRYFPIAFLGCSGDSLNKGNYIYKMREELKEALQEMDLEGITTEYNNGDQENSSAFDKNMILYGPPGTGKTYSTAIYAVAICDGVDIDKVKAMDYAEVMARYRDLTAAGRVAFTTFHQSYGYEEFIEGIKPIVDSEKKDVGYTIEPGVFKSFCSAARKKTVIAKDDTPDVSDARVWCVLLDGAGVSALKTRCFKEGSIRIGWHESPEIITEETEGLNDKVRRILLNFQDEMEVGDIVVAERSNKSIDGIGIVTGDYEFEKDDSENWARKRNVKWLMTGKEIDLIELNSGKNLDRKTVYALDRIEADKILELVNNPSEVVIEERTNPFVFVIDEINRGNISKIFGELITLIEDTKREGMDEQVSAILPYSGDPFSVPSNVYILGTMNTADRSIALMDTALRRRFQFIEMMPDADVLRAIGADKVDDLDVAAMLEKINERITFLYDREHTIGHAFFTKLANSPDLKTLQVIFEKSVIPLLQEYFYEDYQKIQLILGDNGKTDPKTKFILDEEVKVKNIFKGNADDAIDLPEKKYSINKEAFSNIESYKQII